MSSKIRLNMAGALFLAAVTGTTGPASATPHYRCPPVLNVGGSDHVLTSLAVFEGHPEKRVELVPERVDDALGLLWQHTPGQDTFHARCRYQDTAHHVVLRADGADHCRFSASPPGSPGTAYCAQGAEPSRPSKPAAQAACAIPDFESSSEPSSASSQRVDPTWIELSAEPVAMLFLPATLAKAGIMPHGSFVFRSDDERVSGGFAYETEASISIHQAGVLPGAFLASVFRAETESACVYAQGLRLSEQDYRIHLRLEGGAVYAFGKHDVHHFFVLNDAHPEVAINGMVKGIDTGQFRILLSRIQIK